MGRGVSLHNRWRLSSRSCSNMHRVYVGGKSNNIRDKALSIFGCLIYHTSPHTSFIHNGVFIRLSIYPFIRSVLTLAPQIRFLMEHAPLTVGIHLYCVWTIYDVCSNQLQYFMSFYFGHKLINGQKILFCVSKNRI